MRHPALRAAAILVAALFLRAGAAGLFAQELRLTATPDTNALRIGEQVRVTVAAEHPGGYVIRNVGPSDSLAGLEIVGIDSGGAAGAGGGTAAPFRRVYSITAFDSGTYVLPPFIAYYRPGSDTAIRSASSAPVVLSFRGVDVDTSAEIRAIKPPLGAPLTLAEILPYLGAIAAAALLAWLVYYMLKKRKRGEKFIPGPPARPADEIALEALRSIEAEKLWQRGKVKEYHSALSDVLRRYIESRYGVLAMESTSDEILAFAPVSALEPAAVAALREVLTRSDLVKFAKLIPPPDQNERSIAHSVSFVELTRGAAPAAAVLPERRTAAAGIVAPVERSAGG
jgi:hypothetical protein